MESVKEILTKAGFADVSDDTFRVDNNDEEISYLCDVPNMSVRKSDDGNTVVIQVYAGSSKLDKFKKMETYTEKNKKCFLFYQFGSKEDMDFNDIIFSLEIVQNPDITSHIQLFADLKQPYNILHKSTEKIIRFIPDKTKMSITNSRVVHVVAIKIGPENNRDYTALKHYIVSSDNRTYNKVVRNMVEYIEISSEKKAPTNESKLPHNLLVSGAPGTGKSYYLGKSLLDAGEALINAAVLGGMSTERAKKQYCDEFVTRVTFYEDYSYENFVGCYKPVPDNSEATILYDNKDGKITENKITYKFVAGPFIDTYLKAKKDKEHNYFLIIEEINRAKAASVFGDMFQLLDRKDGESVYEIQPDAALREYLEIHGEDGLMKLPSNMYIWATMNSADQGVMPLDSAFKRRWASLYMDINNDEAARVAYITVTSDKKILWESLRTKINQVILSNGFDEDRCIGAWYFSEEEISQINAFFTKTAEDRRNAVNPLVDKLFYYLRQDVFRRNPSAMFKPNDGEENGITMSDIRRRIRMGETLDGILNLKDLQWE